MKLSRLAEETGVSITTVKYYLREGLLPAGRLLSRTQAEYGEAHVERIRLIRGLVEVGGLDVATVHRVLMVIGDPPKDRVRAVEAVHDALHVARPRTGAAEDVQERWAVTWARARGWTVDDADPLFEDLEEVWRANEEAGVQIDRQLMMDVCADAVERIARVDIASLPGESVAMARQLLLGTVALDPVIAVLRRMAQRQEALNQFAD